MAYYWYDIASLWADIVSQNFYCVDVAIVDVRVYLFFDTHTILYTSILQSIWTILPNSSSKFKGCSSNW